MKNYVIKSMVVAAMVFTGCSSVVTSDGATKVPLVDSSAPGYTAEFKHSTARVSGSSQLNVLFGVITWGIHGYAENSDIGTFSLRPSFENFVKSAAVFNACRANSADILLGTRYTITTTNYFFVFKKIKCEISGFPAYMTGVVKNKPYFVSDKNGNGQIVWLPEKPIVLK